MKISVDIEKSLHDTIIKNGKKNGRSMSAEIRFQLMKIYGEGK